MRREAEIRPSALYLDRHNALGAGITADIRAIAVSWLVEVVGEFGLQQETLFLGVTYLDRFLTLSQVNRFAHIQVKLGVLVLLTQM